MFVVLLRSRNRYGRISIGRCAEGIRHGEGRSFFLLADIDESNQTIDQLRSITFRPVCPRPPRNTEMKCVQASKFGNINTVLTLVTDKPRPTLTPRGRQMLIRVEACSLNPLDCCMLSGECSQVVGSPSFPYIPGMGVCGVVEVIAKAAKFKVGDRVIASTGPSPTGGLAEYAAASIDNADLAPVNVDAIRAAALPNSAMTAMLILRRARITAGARVMVLGGSGGVGTALVQLVKRAGASFIATTSTDEPLMRSLGADMVIDYRTTKWWEETEFKEQPFDLVVDCVGWRDEWPEAGRHGALKSGFKGGQYLTITTTDKSKIHNTCDGARVVIPTLWRTMWTAVAPWKPRYEFLAPRTNTDDWPQLTSLVEAKVLKPVLNPASPFPFTIDGVRRAFELQASNHAHGKVVINIQS